MLLIRSSIQKLLNSSCQITVSNINITQIRTKVIYYLPNPTEVRRVRKQGYLKKVQTRSGRKQLMERILKGDKVIAQ